MSAEWVGAIANVATLAVIVATALAAFVQLRHMRGSNQILAINEARETLESAEFRAAQLFIFHDLTARLADPVERAKALTLPPRGDYQALTQVGNVLEGLGLFVKHGIIDADIVCDNWSLIVTRNWEIMAPIIAWARHTLGSDSLWENFEYLAVVSEDYRKRRPLSYPPGVRRMPVDRSLLDPATPDEA